MFDFFKLLLTEGEPNDTWYIWVILGAFFLLLIGTQVINGRKRQKQVQDMISNLAVGSEVKTIGGFVGVIVAMDDMKGLLTINIGTIDSPTYAVIDRAGIYNVASALKPDVADSTYQLEAPKAQLPEGETTKQAETPKSKSKSKKEYKDVF